MRTKLFELGRNIFAVIGLVITSTIAIAIFLSPQMDGLRAVTVAMLLIVAYIVSDYLGLKIAPWIGVSAIIGIIIWIIIAAIIVAPY
jgi:hypothetical protein